MDHFPFVLQCLEVKSVTYCQTRRVLVVEEAVVLELHLRRLKALWMMLLYLEEVGVLEEALMWVVEG